MNEKIGVTLTRDGKDYFTVTCECGSTVKDWEWSENFVTCTKCGLELGYDTNERREEEAEELKSKGRKIE